ncbi:MAG: RecX family transcriptional regulator [Bergeyella sp.]|nr:RecX family transcriptional regulator [Bergeyella sp.]
MSLGRSRRSFAFDDIKKKLERFCIYQERCHVEVENKMKEFLLIPEARDRLYLHLIQEGYLNEERFTRNYVRGKFRQKKWGRIKIIQSLKQKKIAENLIRKGLEEIDEEDYRETLFNLYESCEEKIKEPDKGKKINKITRYLLSKGYEYEVICKVGETLRKKV